MSFKVRNGSEDNLALFPCEEQPTFGDRVRIERIRDSGGELRVWEVSVIAQGNQELSKALFMAMASSEEKDPTPHVFWAENGGSELGKDQSLLRAF